MQPPKSAMESKLSNTESEAIKTLATDWAESEWFQVWMRLSRHADDKPRSQSQVTLPKKEMAAR
jgi:hypothetical protein